MKITIKSEKIADDFMQKAKKMLPHYMQTMPVTVALVESAEEGRHYFQKAPDLFWDLVEEGKFLAGFQYQTANIVVFLQNFDDDGYFHLNVANSFFHECRHAYQYYYLPNIFTYEDERFDQDARKETYCEQWVERDANYFSFTMLHLNKDELLPFLGDTPWNIQKREAAPRHPVLQEQLSQKSKKWRLLA